ncbi:MAG: STAS domain-containing protein [Chloroflexi bacterium]|nr:STAS domain-containing protein [Chloroflexota bacterium]
MDIILAQETGRVPVTLFRLQGQLNLGSVAQLEAHAKQAYDSGARYLLIDLSGVSSLTSAGMRAVLAIVKQFDTESGKSKVSRNVKLLNPPANILRVLTIAGFDSFIEIHDDLRKAVASF